MRTEEAIAYRFDIECGFRWQFFEDDKPLKWLPRKGDTLLLDNEMKIEIRKKIAHCWNASDKPCHKNCPFFAKKSRIKITYKEVDIEEFYTVSEVIFERTFGYIYIQLGLNEDIWDRTQF